MPLKTNCEIEIILDARMINHSGIGTYLQGLVGKFGPHPFFRENRLGLLTSEAFRAPIYSIQEQLEYPFRLARCRLWHAPHYNIPFFKCGTSLVVTVHDLIHWIFRKEFYSVTQAFYAQAFFRRVVQLADRIIAVSKQTKDDLIQYFGATPERVRVIYEGVCEEFFIPPDPTEREQLLKRHGISTPFFLYVGLIKPHKNLKRLVSVFRKLQSERKIQSGLVLVGKKDRHYRCEDKVLQDLHTEDGIWYLPSVGSRQELRGLYASARALIHPSYYEGFGLTVLEAMAAGTPVIASRTASLPEVVGEAGRLIDPYSDQALEAAILELEEDGMLRERLAAKGRERAREFTWEKAAHETVEVYRELLSCR